jgi:hypothetical protein
MYGLVLTHYTRQCYTAVRVSATLLCASVPLNFKHVATKQPSQNKKSKPETDQRIKIQARDQMVKYNCPFGAS